LREEELIKEQLTKNSEHAFAEIFRMYHPCLCNYAFKILQDEDDAKEVAQQTLIALWEKRTDALEIKSLSSFLFRSAHNNCLNRFKHSKVKDKYLTEERYLFEGNFYESFENTYDPEHLKQIKDAIEELPAKNRDVFKMRYIDNLKTKDVAEKMNISSRTVETHVSNALKLLREKLKNLVSLTVLLLFLSFFYVHSHELLSHFMVLLWK